MGRKSITKNRRQKNKKVEQWTQAIIPKLRNRELGSLTIDDLAVLLNKSKSTIYEYFTTKEEIFEYITQVRIDHIKAYKKEISGKILEFIHSYEMLAKILAEGVQDISPFYLKQLQIHYPTAWKIIEDFLQDLLRDLKDFYVLGIENKMFRAVSADLLIKLDEYFIKQLVTDYNFFNSNQQTLPTAIREYLFVKFEGLIIK